MWAGETMTFLESVVASLLGLSVVFCTLIALAVAIIVISKILGLIIKDETTKPAAAAAAPKAAVTCPYCGATTTPDASGCCEFCGGAING